MQPQVPETHVDPNDGARSKRTFHRKVKTGCLTCKSVHPLPLAQQQTFRTANLPT